MRFLIRAIFNIWLFLGRVFLRLTDSLPHVHLGGFFGINVPEAESPWFLVFDWFVVTVVFPGLLVYFPFAYLGSPFAPLILKIITGVFMLAPLRVVRV